MTPWSKKIHTFHLMISEYSQIPHCSALTPVDEIKQIGGIINGFVLKVNYGRDYEKQLQFYDEARGAFTNIDLVLAELIQVNYRPYETMSFDVSKTAFMRSASVVWGWRWVMSLAVITLRRREDFFRLALHTPSSRFLPWKTCTRSCSFII